MPLVISVSGSLLGDDSSESSSRTCPRTDDAVTSSGNRDCDSVPDAVMEMDDNPTANSSTVCLDCVGGGTAGSWCWSSCLTCSGG